MMLPSESVKIAADAMVGHLQQRLASLEQERDLLRAKLAAERSACEELTKQIAEMVPVSERDTLRARVEVLEAELTRLRDVVCEQDCVLIDAALAAGEGEK